MVRNRVDDPALKILLDPNYDMLNEAVEEVHTRSVRIPKKERKIVNKNFKKVMDVFISTMKEVDSTFNDIFRELRFTGSFFEGLKISNANEYDVNVIIEPDLEMKPIRKKKYSPPGYVAIEVIEDNIDCLPWPYNNWIYHHEVSNRYFLKINEIRFWLQSVVTKAKDRIEDEELITDFELEIRESGPAWTLIFKDQNRSVSIDLVPCLEFDNEDWPGIPRKSEKILNADDVDPWYAVPKGPRNPPSYITTSPWFIAWRLSFPIQEKHVMNDLNYLKYTIRLLKQVRDQLKIYAVASYYIKTLFLWEIETLDITVWDRLPRGRLFLYMLVRFKEALERGQINFYWDRRYNLIEHIQEDYLRISANRLENFIRKIKNYINNEDEDGLRVFITSKLCSPSDPTNEQSLFDGFSELCEKLMQMRPSRWK